MTLEHVVIVAAGCLFGWFVLVGIVAVLGLAVGAVQGFMDSIR